MILQERQQELQYLHQEWKSERCEGLELPWLGDLDKIIACNNFPFGTEDAVFKTGSEVPLPIELEEGVAE